MADVQCPDCNLEMEIGYIPDMADAGGVIQMVWHASTLKPVTIFGLKTGSVKPNDNAKTPLPIWAFRCPNCGMLRLHAIAASDDESAE